MSEATLDEVVAALDAPVDHGPSFTGLVASLAISLRERCVPGAHEQKPTDYSAGQAISWETDDSGERWRIKVHLSSRGPLFAVIYYRQRGREWWRQPEDQAPASIRALVDSCVDEQLSELSLKRVPQPLFEKPAEGHLTEVDGAPATVFQRLFSEVD